MESSLQISKTIQEARGILELGMYRDAWSIIEKLPAAARMTPQALAVRLLVCAGLEIWDMGLKLARNVTPEYPLDARKAAGHCHLGYAEGLWRRGDLAGAIKAARAGLKIWPEGRAVALQSEALAEIL